MDITNLSLKSYRSCPSAADVLAIPSHHESFGLVALESLACGTPVVATKVGAMEDIVREDETGCVLRNAAPRLLANKIGQFTSNACQRVRSADSIRASVIRFSWSNVADALIKEYRTVISRWKKFYIFERPIELDF